MQNSYQSVTLWKSPAEIDKTAPNLWGEKGIRPAAVQQGGLGDCWFLSAMAALAEWKDRVQKSFNGQESYAADGLFQVNFYTAGKVEKVTIDDRLPVKDSYGDYYPVNLRRSPNKAWWGPIMEKAAAKFFGRYENMNGGQEVESLYALTGMPTMNFKLTSKTEDDLWNTLNEYNNRNYVMCTGVSGDASEKREGLVMNHAYTLIGTGQYNGQKLVKIRNPWGNEKYEGSWSDKDTAKWTPDALQALGHVVQDDGIFWMPVSEYRRLFTDVSIAMYQNWQISNKQASWDRSKDPNTVNVQINNPQKQRVVVGLIG